MKIKILTTALLLLITFSIRLYAQQDVELNSYNNQKEITANKSITLKPGVTITEGSEAKLYITADPGPNVGTKPDYKMNTIITYTAKVPGLVNIADTTNGAKQVSVEVQTFDQFGRLKEIHLPSATPSYNNLVTLKTYDGQGRESLIYQPYATLHQNGAFASQGYTPIVWGFHGSLSLANDGLKPNSMPFTERKYEESPLNRLLEQSAPGPDFAAGVGHTKRSYELPAFSDVIRYKAEDGVLSRDGGDYKYYAINNLSMMQTEDENVIQHGMYTGPDTRQSGAVYEIKDMEGRVVLRRQLRTTGQAPDENNPGQMVSTWETLSTYYVYDSRGNLTFVLTPKAEPDGASQPNQTTLDNLCYQYLYDKESRMIAKKLPGKGWEYMVYNTDDQVVMTQDAVQRGKAAQEWNIIKYDKAGRPALTGIYTHPGSTPGTNYRAFMQASVNQQTVNWENRAATTSGYTAYTYPTSGYSTLSLNYYDDYDLPGGNPYPYSGADVSLLTRGLATATRTNVLGTADMLWTVSYYDSDGRNIKTFKQHYKGGAQTAGNYDELTTTYDFTGNALTATRSHKVGDIETLKIYNEYTYDHMGRKLDSWQTINTGTRTLLARNQYNELGMLFKKHLHSTNGSTFLQTITYNYNERGWITRLQADKLDVNVRYTDPTHFGNSNYNGNVSELEYTGTYSGNKYFTYAYDAFNRLTDAGYDVTGALNEYIAYDKQGNITSLTRSNGSPITYSYANSGASNQLSSTTGPVAGSFTYDVNGNQLTDSRRGVTLTYNQLNLPQTVIGSNTASYKYNAAGVKLSSVQQISTASAITREYIDGVQYTDNIIDFIATEEGRALRDKTTGLYKYEYNLKDHLGNNRVTIDDNAGVARVVQEDEYYAFGLNAVRYRNGTENKYLYNGKEEQEALTDELDYGARFYDPVVGRWTSVDPSAENDASYSPYIYGFNNPLRFTDPDGRWPDWEQLGKGTLKVVGGSIAVVAGVVGGTASSVTVVGAVAGAAGAAAGAGAIVLGAAQIGDSFKTKGKPMDVPDIPGAVASGVSKKFGASDKTAATIGTITDVATGGKPSTALDFANLTVTTMDFMGTSHSATVKKPLSDHTTTSTAKPKPVVQPKSKELPKPKPQTVIRSADKF